MIRTLAATVLAAISLACIVASPSGSGDGGDTGTNSSVVGRTCTFGCTMPNDCVQATGRPAADFACTSGACVDLGCQSDNECIAAMGAGYVCRAYNGLVPGCTHSCASVSDCASTYSGLFAADELSCDSGGCRYRGCQSDSECSSMGSGLVCRAFGTALPNCTPVCQTNQDCASAYRGTYNADEFTCESGACHLLGCQSDTECPSSSNGQAPLCR